MNALNHATTRVFDLLLWPFERLGPELSLVLTSGIFGILALIAFKFVSWQAGIKRTKDLIKGHLIAIRIYQDDLRIVGGSVLRILLRNAQYVALNFAPILPLAAPFTLIAAQLVVRYGFAPVPVHASAQGLLPGQGLAIAIELRPGQSVEQLQLILPEGVAALSPLVRIESEQRALQEIVALRDGRYELVALLPNGERATKLLVAGAAQERTLQPERVGSFWSAWLWPAEERFGADSAFQRFAFSYPSRELAWLPDGPGGVLLTFLLAAMAFGIAILKPLGIQI
jgi:hypothetical protein